MARVLAAALVVAATAALGAAGLTFTAPAGWKQAPPSTGMRVAQFTLPRADGDPEDAELIVYYFGGEGGSVEANIERWLSQMQQPNGGSAKAAARQQTRTVNGLKVTLLDVSGTYAGAAMTPGATSGPGRPNYRMRAGVVQTDRGPYFIKLTGPQKTVTKWDQAFDEFVASLKYQA